MSIGENCYCWPLKRVWKKVASQGKVSEKSGNLDMDIEWQPCCVSTLSNMNISETNGSIATKFYLKHHWDAELDALGFGPDRIRTLVSMATESSHRVILVKMVSPLFLCCFSSNPFHTCR